MKMERQNSLQAGLFSHKAIRKNDIGKSRIGSIKFHIAGTPGRLTLAEHFRIRTYGFLMFAYFIVYLAVFHWLETRTVFEYHVVHTPLDDMIPFCEVFIIPYYLWFLYILVTVCFFIIRTDEKTGYYQLAANLMMGMTVFLIVSYAYPNMLELRPEQFERQNIFTDMVAGLYRIDTSTNVLPSIHVYNSIACHLAIAHSPVLRRYKAVQVSSFLLMNLIILSTMFLKQHSVVDVCLGSTLALLGYLFFYSQESAQHSGDFDLVMAADTGKGRRNF